MLPCANRADKAGWPAPAHHRLPALILCSVKNSKLGLAEPLLKLHLVARHRLNQQRERYPAEMSGQNWSRQKARDEAESEGARQQAHEADGNREGGRGNRPLRL